MWKFPKIVPFLDFTWAQKFYGNTSQIVQTLTIWHSAHENSPVDRHADRSRVASRRNYDKLLTMRCFVTEIMKMTAAKHWSKCKALAQMPECSSTHWQKCSWLYFVWCFVSFKAITRTLSDPHDDSSGLRFKKQHDQSAASITACRDKCPQKCICNHYRNLSLT